MRTLKPFPGAIAAPKRRRLPHLTVVGLVWMELFLIGASGCAFTRGQLETPLNEDEVSAIKKGTTTEGQVVEMFGAPDGILEINHQEVFHYYQYGLKHASVLVFSRVNIASDDLYVFFDQHGVVDRVLFGTKTDKLKFQFWPFGG